MRGEVEVVAVLFTTLIVVGGFAVLWVWLYPRYLEWERQLMETVLNARAAAEERVVVELAHCKEGALRVVLLSTGRIGVRILSVYVNDTLAWSGSLYLAPGQYSAVTTSAPCGRVYGLKVCSARGNCWSFLEKDFESG